MLVKKTRITEACREARALLVHITPPYREIYPILGRVGKAFILITAAIILGAIVLLVSGCSGNLGDTLQSGEVIGMIGLEGRWAGPVVPRAEGCGSADTGLMTVGRNSFSFDPFQGTTVIDGTVADTRLDGFLSRPGNGQQMVSISFSGKVVRPEGGEQVIQGLLLSGPCSWTVSLKRA